jgi:hypothetical protein
LDRIKLLEEKAELMDRENSNLMNKVAESETSLAEAITKCQNNNNVISDDSVATTEDANNSNIDKELAGDNLVSVS